MRLFDENPRVMNRLGQTQFEHLRLKSALQEIFRFQAQNVIEFHFRLVQNTRSYKTTQKSIS